MSFTDKHIVETYSELLDGLSSSSKLELIAHLSKSIEKEEKAKENRFYKSFGAFSDDLPAEEMIANIKADRKFRKKEIML